MEAAGFSRALAEEQAKLIDDRLATKLDREARRLITRADFEGHRRATKTDIDAGGGDSGRGARARQDGGALRQPTRILIH
jgi:hypothetical protein